MLERFLSWQRREKKHQIQARDLVQGRQEQLVGVNKELRRAYDAVDKGDQEQYPGIKDTWNRRSQVEKKLNNARGVEACHGENYNLWTYLKHLLIQKYEGGS